MRKLILVHAIVASTTLVGLTRAEAPPAATPATQPASATTAVKHGSLTLTIDGQAAFDPLDTGEVRLRFKAYQGELRITSIVPNGKAVKKGDVILEIDPAPMKRAVTAIENEALVAVAAYDRAKAEVKILEKSDAIVVQQQEEALKEAEADVQWFEKVDGPQMIKQVDIALQQAKDLADDQQDELDQLKKLYKSEELTNATADIVVKRALRQLELSRAGYKMAKDRSEKAYEFSYPALKKKVYEGLEIAHQQYALFHTAHEQGLIVRKANLATAQAAADAANLKLEEIKADAEKLTAHASIDGVVCYGSVVNGALTAGDPKALRPDEHVTAGGTVLTVYHPGRFRLVTDLPEAKFFAIKPGQKVSVTPTAFPELKYEGQCDAVPHTALGAGGYQMTISTGELDQRIVPGMKADYHMDVPLADNVLLVPVSAVKDSAVSVKNGDNYDSRHVLTGRSDGKMIEILSGVREGDEVATQAK